MNNHWRKWTLILLACIWPLLSFAQSVTLTAIHKSAQKDSWDIQLATATSVNLQHFALSNPNRLVIDVPGATAFKNSISLASTPILKIRTSLQPQQTLRIVLDLKPGIPPNRIHISLNTPHKTVNAKPQPVVSVPAARASRDIIVVIDPGHGGKDPGATGIKKIHEKDVVLSIAKKLQLLINQQPGFKAVLTRNGDYYLTLRERLTIARKNKADMFIAIHADAYPDPLAHGVSVFALSQRGATSEAARWLAARENQSELMGGVDLTDKGDVLRSVLINLSQTATIQASLSIGQNLLDNVHPFAHLHHNHMEQAAFVVLKSPDIPSLLIETGFLSNTQEEGKLKSNRYQYDLAHAMMLGIKQYFIHRPPPGTWLAAQDSRFKNG